MAVRLDIRPRLVLRNEPVAKVRRGARLPPLTFPALAYWLGMGALTYFFAHLGENPLESAFASTELQSAPAPALEPSPLPPAPPAPSPTPASSPPHLPPSSPEPETAPPVETAAAAEPFVALTTPERGRADGDRGWDRDRNREPQPELDRVEAPAAEPPRLAMKFPEFTDTSRSAQRERAAGGPRIDSDLFGDGRQSRERPEPAPDSSRAPEADASRPAVAVSCEAAMARNREEITIGGARGPVDITRDAYAGILENGRYLSGCSIPERTVFEVCAAVRNGRAVGITVSSNPPNATLNGCVRRAVSRLEFPANPRLDVTRTRFDAVRR